MFLLVTSFHVPDHHLWQAIPVRRWTAEADTYTPGLGCEHNRALQSREKKHNESATKAEGRVLSLIHSRWASHAVGQQEETRPHTLLLFSQPARRKEGAAQGFPQSCGALAKRRGRSQSVWERAGSRFLKMLLYS